MSERREKYMSPYPYTLPVWRARLVLNSHWRFMGQHPSGGGAVAGILFPLGGTQVLKGDPKHK